MKLPLATLDEVLGLYQPECRFLKEAEFLYPEIRGRFGISQSFYLNPGMDTGHFNAVDMMICYNQMAFSFFAEAVRRELIPELSYENIKRTPIKNSFIIGMDNIHFKTIINPQEFEGRFRLLETTSKKEGKLYLFRTEYDFGAGKATGNVNLALVL